MTKAEIAAAIKAKTGENIDIDSYKKDELEEYAKSQGVDLDDDDDPNGPPPENGAANTEPPVPEGMVKVKLKDDAQYGGVRVGDYNITRTDPAVISQEDFDSLKDEYGLEES